MFYLALIGDIIAFAMLIYQIAKDIIASKKKK